MTITQSEYIKSQIKIMLSVRDILDFYIGDRNRNGRYKCPFNHTESNKNLGVKGDHLCRCFSCSESWDEISFVQKLFGCKNYHDALERIALDFNLDTKEEIDKDTARKIQQGKKARDAERQRLKEREECISALYNKICQRQYQLEEVIRKHLPFNSKNLTKYSYTEHPDFVIMAEKQRIRNGMLLNVLSESETDDRTDFLYGLAPFPEDRKERREKIVDMIQQGMIKINEKGDVLYG